MATPLSPLGPLDARGSALGDAVYAALGEAILRGALPPGERLRDHDLADRLGVSRTPVREALQRLERIGLVDVAPHRYTRVSVPDPKSAADTDEFVAYVLADCVRIVLSRADDESVRTAASLARDVAEASSRGDRLGMLEGLAALFTHVVRATNNSTFLTVFAVGEFAIRRDLVAWAPAVTDPAQRTRLYEQLADALTARDGDGAERIIHRLHGIS